MSNDEKEYYDNLDGNSTYKVHRIILKDILIDGENPPEGFDRSLSIPFSGKIRSVWAPNGYGKTYAFNILSLLSKANISSNSRIKSIIYGGAGWENLEGFFQLCYSQLHKSENDYFTEHASELSTKVKKHMIPFKEIIFRLVESSNDHIVDISITPYWPSFRTGVKESFSSKQALSVKRKFWNMSSLDTTFFEKYGDDEIEEILKFNKSIRDESIIIKPVFIESFNRELPEGNVYISDHSSVANIDVEEIFCNETTEIAEFLKGIQDKSLVDFDENDLDLLDRIIKFDFDLPPIEVDELLLELFEFTKRTQALPFIDEHRFSKNKEILYESNKDDIFNYLFILMDVILNDDGLPASWRIFEEVPNYWHKDRETSVSWDEQALIEAIINLNITYFEIPNIINYSSNLKLQNAQISMTNMLKIIKYSNLSFIEDRDEYDASQDIQIDVDYYSNLYSILNFIKKNLGNRPDTLRNFLEPLTNFKDWDKLLEDLNEIEDLDIDYIVHEYEPIPNLLSHDSSDTLDRILRFVEIFENINKSLNRTDSGSWAVSCRFNTWNNPMKFMDSINEYDLDSSILSFGQCSVVALESCFGQAFFYNMDRSNVSEQTQSCIIIDEPEIGRSEHWVSMITDRIIELLDDFEEPHLGNIYNESLTIVSHKERLLRSLSITGNYHVMQPFDEEEEE